MSAIWTIIGEAGKALDDTERSFAELGYQQAVLDFPGLDVDELRFSLLCPDLTGAGVTIPELNQEISVERSGTRVFVGQVTKVRQRSHVVEVVASGPYWWMQNRPLSSNQTDPTGGTAERVSYQFPEQSLTDSIMDLINRSIALGCPWQLGDVADTWDFPPITLQQMMFGDALAELVRLCPDMMMAIDYSTSPPTVNFTRRKAGLWTGSATVIDVDAREVEDFTIEPILELLVEQVRVPYVTRATDGRRQFAEQSSGDAGTAQGGASATITLRSGASPSTGAYNGLPVEILSGTGAGQTRTISTYNGTTKVATVTPAWTTPPDATSVYKVGEGLADATRLMMLPVSGEELDTFLPNDYFDSYAIQTAAASSISVGQVMGMLREVQSSRLAHSDRPYDTEPFLGDGDPLIYELTSDFSGGTRSIPTQALAYLDPVTGVPISTTGKYVVLTSNLPQWLPETGATLTPARMVGQLWYEHYTDGYQFPYTAGDRVSLDPLADWAEDFPWSAQETAVGYTGSMRSGEQSAPPLYNHYRVDLYRLGFELDVTLIDVAYGSPTTIYRPADYAFISPPAGFAAGLCGAQGWVPYTGSFSVTEAVAGSTSYRGKVVNLTHARPELAACGALVAGETWELDSGRTLVRLGAPPKLDYRTIVDRVRSHSAQQIVYL